MENLEQKIWFLKQEFVSLLRTIKPDTLPLFGKMNPQQMAEHMAEYIRMAYGNPVITSQSYSGEITEKMNLFLRTEKPFKPNTPNPLMEKTPPPVKLTTYDDAVKDVETSISELFAAFEQEPERQVFNPFFGMLDFPLSIQLLTKHAQHHLRQFGAID
ncbi:MAG: hypothetical protein V4561_13260 [Bacteroidota bacterium]